jgi:hypothetical protein
MLVLIAINVSIDITNEKGISENSLALLFHKAEAQEEGTNHCDTPYVVGDWVETSRTWSNEGTTHICTILYTFTPCEFGICGISGSTYTQIIYVYE